MQQYLAGFGQWVDRLSKAVIFVVCVLTFRRGVIGEIAHYFPPFPVSGKEFRNVSPTFTKQWMTRPVAARCGLPREK